MAGFRVRDQQGRTYGPIDAGELRPWITEGRLTEDMLLQQEGSADWYRAGDVPALAKIFAQRKAAMGSAGASARKRAQEETLEIQPDTSDNLGADDDAASQSRPEDAEPAPPPPPNSPSSNPLNAESQSQPTEPQRMNVVQCAAFNLLFSITGMVVGLVVALIATGILSKAWPEYESIFQFQAPVGARYITNFGDATRAITYLVGLTLGFVAGQVVFVVRFWRR
jgi:hypothetical protein